MAWERAMHSLYHTESKQANGFVVNLTGSKLTEKEIVEQGYAIFRRRKTLFVEKLVLIKNGEILAILEKI